ncbi:hypothetical protein PHLCEN_2v6612 [Hermanssonia centrifuga]|uniref:Uncharacterized protein n=1 Tax=Hermanssonia centrifuga TaxID=98765 RepID=A0A2R6NYS6_9APHY|nr:hypothetical protein PHLCEN_2v6612 [Hermanssonia centrifuga]
MVKAIKREATQVKAIFLTGSVSQGAPRQSSATHLLLPNIRNQTPRDRATTPPPPLIRAGHPMIVAKPTK